MKITAYAVVDVEKLPQTLIIGERDYEVAVKLRVNLAGVQIDVDTIEAAEGIITSYIRQVRQIIKERL